MTATKQYRALSAFEQADLQERHEALVDACRLVVLFDRQDTRGYATGSPVCKAWQQIRQAIRKEPT